MAATMAALRVASSGLASTSFSLPKSQCSTRSNPTPFGGVQGLANSSLRGTPLRRQVAQESCTVRRRQQAVQAVATPTAPPPMIAPDYDFDGFTQVGEPVPDGISMSDVLRSFPKEVFEIDDMKAFRSVLTTVLGVGAGYTALAVAPWYLYPAVYAYMSAAVTGCFVIGHDCGHNSFSKSQLVNDIVGTIMFAPLIYPFEPWRIKHNTHHAHTNKLVVDTAWQPFQPRIYDKAPPVARALMEAAMGPFWWVASVGHWLIWHFDLNKFKLSEQGKVKVSLAAVYGFMALVLAPLLVLGGPVAFVKWWLLPWLGFHFWMSTFTLIHHTAPHIPFKPSKDWDQVKAQLGGTVHCEFPAWVDILCHDISVHIPHHLSTKIPSYNLRMAYASLEKNWNPYLNKAKFGLPLMKTILKQCNLFDVSKKRWVKFDPHQRV